MLKKGVQKKNKTLLIVLIALIVVVVVFAVGSYLSKSGKVETVPLIGMKIGEDGSDPCKGDWVEDAKIRADESRCPKEDKKFCRSDGYCAECIANEGDVYVPDSIDPKPDTTGQATSEGGVGAAKGQEVCNEKYNGYGVCKQGKVTGGPGSYNWVLLEERDACHCTGDGGCPGDYSYCHYQVKHCYAKPCFQNLQEAKEEKPYEVPTVDFFMSSKGGSSQCGSGEVCVKAVAQISKDVNERKCAGEDIDVAATITEIRRGLGVGADADSSTRICIPEDPAWCDARVTEDQYYYFNSVYPKIRLLPKYVSGGIDYYVNVDRKAPDMCEYYGDVESGSGKVSLRKVIIADTNDGKMLTYGSDTCSEEADLTIGSGASTGKFTKLTDKEFNKNLKEGRAIASEGVCCNQRDCQGNDRKIVFIDNPAHIENPDSPFHSKYIRTSYGCSELFDLSSTDGYFSKPIRTCSEFYDTPMPLSNMNKDGINVEGECTYQGVYDRDGINAPDKWKYNGLYCCKVTEFTNIDFDY